MGNREVVIASDEEGNSYGTINPQYSYGELGNMLVLYPSEQFTDIQMSNYKTVQIKQQDLDKIAQLAKRLEKELGIKISYAQAIMYAINKLDPK